MAKKSKIVSKDSDDDEPSENNLNTMGATKEKKGLNYTAIALMLMFGLPVLLALIIQSIDLLYPTAAVERKFRDRIIRCYEAANPTKLSDVDKFVGKYKGKEHILFAQLRNKYEKFPECHF